MFLAQPTSQKREKWTQFVSCVWMLLEASPPLFCENGGEKREKDVERQFLSFQFIRVKRIRNVCYSCWKQRETQMRSWLNDVGGKIALREKHWEMKMFWSKWRKKIYITEKDKRRERERDNNQVYFFDMAKMTLSYFSSIKGKRR